MCSRFRCPDPLTSHQAGHVADLGLRAAEDGTILHRAEDHGHAFVTADRCDASLSYLLANAPSSCWWRSVCASV